jgi:hypothetical protein
MEGRELIGAITGDQNVTGNVQKPNLLGVPVFNAESGNSEGCLLVQCRSNARTGRRCYDRHPPIDVGWFRKICGFCEEQAVDRIEILKCSSDKVSIGRNDRSSAPLSYRLIRGTVGA